jgi:hypothetical protein
VDLGAVDAASVLSRALFPCPIKEARPSSPHKPDRAKMVPGVVENQKRDVDRGQISGCRDFTKKGRASSEQQEKVEPRSAEMSRGKS